MPHSPQILAPNIWSPSGSSGASEGYHTAAAPAIHQHCRNWSAILTSKRSILTSHPKYLRLCCIPLILSETMHHPLDHSHGLHPPGLHYKRKSSTISVSVGYLPWAWPPRHPRWHSRFFRTIILPRRRGWALPFLQPLPRYIHHWRHRYIPPIGSIVPSASSIQACYPQHLLDPYKHFNHLVWRPLRLALRY